MSRPDPRPRRSLRRSLCRRPSLEFLEARELLTGFVVMNTADSGDGSLRAAILAADADSSVGADSISFQIATGSKTITPASALPAITRSIVIDGSTQSGYGSGVNPAPVVVIDGSTAGSGASGLTLSAGSGSYIRGLSIVNFASGSGILLTGSATGTTIESDYLGVMPDGFTAGPNLNGTEVDSSGNFIGVDGLTLMNQISGNTNAGVLITGTGATGNIVAGNLIGPDSSGFNGVGNLYGVVLSGSNNTIGGLTVAARNVISANTGPTGQTGIGILYQGVSANNLVEGNYIGTDVSGGTSSTGLGILSNVYGIYFGTPGGSSTDAISQPTIGGTTTGAGNVISGNFLGITGNVTAALIQGNTIGLAADGLKPLANGDGILLGASASTIGGLTAAARNIISASSTASSAAGTGLDLTGDSDLVQGNYIGLTAEGTALTDVGNVTGISLHTTNTTVGGTAAGAGNLIANNTGDGLKLDNNGGNLIAGNTFGRQPDGTGRVYNGGNAINVTLTAPSGATSSSILTLNDTIGGTAAGAGNVLTNSNDGSGVVVFSSYPGTVDGLSLRGNSIFGNSKIGIDLNGSGVPIPGYLFVSGTAASGSNVTIDGIIQGLPLTSYSIDLFGNSATAPVDPSGYGPGQYYLGTASVTTDSSGFATFDPTFAAPSAALTAFSATSTGPDGNTTEFSTNYPSTIGSTDLSITSTASVGTVAVGSPVTFTETITNNGTTTASGVRFFDLLPTSLINATVATTAGSATIDGTNQVTGLLGAIAAGGSVTLSITGTTSALGTLTDNPGVSSTTFDSNYANNEAERTITVIPSVVNNGVDLAITKIASPTVGTVGSNITYTVTVTNLGPNDATGVTANDFLPTSVTVLGYITSQGTASINGTLLTDSLGSIVSGGSATLTVVVRPNANGTVVNSANVSGNQYDPVASNNSTSVSTVVGGTSNVSLLLSSAISTTTGAIGQPLLITLKVTNTGTTDSTNTTIINALPANSVLIATTATQGSAAVIANQVITDDLGTIAAGASATFYVSVVPTTAGAFINFAGVYTPDIPTVAPSFAYAAAFVPPLVTGPTVTGLAGTGSNSQLVISFSSALNIATATNKANYVLTTTNSKGKTSKLTIASLSFNSLANSVNLVASTPLIATQIYKLVIIGTAPSGITDPQGNRLIGVAGGASGTNATFTFLAGGLPKV